MPRPETLPEISVIIPHLNQPAALLACLQRLEAQLPGQAAFEVIVVDNGSREVPSDVCAAFARVTLAREPAPGPGPARSRGAALARGNILAFIDADCLADSDWIAVISAYFSTNPQVSVIGGDVRIARDGPYGGIAAYEAIWGYRMQLYVTRDHYTATCNMAVRAPVFAAVGPFGGIAIAEDVDWGQRASAAGHRIEFVPEMRISTPARQDFSELSRKWRRHIGHDFEDVATRSFGRLRWFLRALMLAVSPLAELPRLRASDRISGPGERFRALACLIRIRLYRSRVMLGLLVSGDSKALSGGWRG